MDQIKELTIFLYTGYTPRASALKERVERACEGKATISLIDSENLISENEEDNSVPIVILDLPNIKQSAVKTIKRVKEITTKSKLLAIHIYTSKLLIDPLLDSGIDGYLTYEPDPTQLRDAIQTVLNGEAYLPAEIYG